MERLVIQLADAGLRLWQWAEDDDRALEAARQAWDRMDRILVWICVAIAVVTIGVAGVALALERASSLKRRILAIGVLLFGCGLFIAVVAKMGVIWLIADPVEAGGPAMGSGAYWLWCLYLFGSAGLGVASVIGSFIVVGAEDI